MGRSVTGVSVWVTESGNVGTTGTALSGLGGPFGAGRQFDRCLAIHDDLVPYAAGRLQDGAAAPSLADLLCAASSRAQADRPAALEVGVLLRPRAACGPA